MIKRLTTTWLVLGALAVGCGHRPTPPEEVAGALGGVDPTPVAKQPAPVPAEARACQASALIEPGPGYCAAGRIDLGATASDWRFTIHDGRIYSASVTPTGELAVNTATLDWLRGKLTQNERMATHVPHSEIRAAGGIAVSAAGEVVASYLFADLRGGCGAIWADASGVASLLPSLQVPLVEDLVVAGVPRVRAGPSAQFLDPETLLVYVSAAGGHDEQGIYLISRDGDPQLAVRGALKTELNRVLVGDSMVYLSTVYSGWDNAFQVEGFLTARIRGAVRDDKPLSHWWGGLGIHESDDDCRLGVTGDDLLVACHGGGLSQIVRKRVEANDEGATVITVPEVVARPTASADVAVLALVGLDDGRLVAHLASEAAGEELVLLERTVP